MRFGLINIIGAAIDILLLIPNIFYMIKNKGEKNLCTNLFMNITEQVGRYACMILMWLPLLVWRFGFASVLEMILYFLVNAVLLTAYYIFFIKHMIRKSRISTATLVVIPTLIFLISGLLLRHWLLVGFAVLFAVGHIYVTIKNTDR